MIFYIGETPDQIPISKFESFMNWAYDQPEYQFDIETDVTDDELRLKKIIWCTKQIITVQFGDINDKEQWVIQWSYLTDEQRAFVKYILECKKTKLIHNAAFECIVNLFHGIRIQNVYDTMLMEMMLNCGNLNYAGDEDDEMENPEEASYYSLSGTCVRRLGFWLEKSEWQMSFGDNILTTGKIIYAATDVRHLGFIRRMQIPEIGAADLDFVAALENEAVLGFSWMTYNGMELNKDEWRANIALAIPIIEEAKLNLAKAVIEDDKLRNKAVQMNHLSFEDKLVVNWNSNKDKRKIMMHFFPDLPGTTKAVLVKWKRDGLGTEEELAVIDPILKSEDYSNLEKFIIYYERDWLIDNEYMVPGGELTINWNSAPQKLELLQAIYPRLQKTDKRALEKLNHVIKEYMAKYSQANKLVSTYGEKFLDHIEPDGKVRSLFKQIVSTGRVATAPNMQNIPVGKGIGTRYRNPFKPGEGNKFVSSDYVSQELVLMAIISGEEVWMGALRNGWDLHSMCAEMVMKERWKKAAEPDCLYYAKKLKCKCKEHKAIRDDIIKPLNFGIPYGMSHFKLAADLKIPVPEAKALLDHYMKTFPKLARMLNMFATYGLKRGYICTIAPFFRRRYFPYWKFVQDKIEHFQAGIIHDSTLGSIERQSKNHPIQGSSADITKTAIVLTYWHIFDNHLDDKVKLRMQVHDQLDSTAVNEYADEWQPQLTKIMEEAALVVVKSGLLKAETKITESWSK